MTGGQQAMRARTAMAAALCLAVLALGVALTAAADHAPLELTTTLPALLLPMLLIPAYVFTSRVTLDFEVRGHTHSVALGQLPLALGVLLVDPPLHLVASLLATVGLVAARRQLGLKGLYNVAIASFEVGATSLAVSLAAGSGGVSGAVWLALLLGLVVSDIVGPAVLGLVWWVLRMPLPAGQLWQPAALGAFTSLTATGLAIIAVSAGRSEPASVALILLFAAGLACAYRKYRRLRQQQETTQDLYAFVRDLGPVDVEDAVALSVMEQVRLLLHAEHLELLTPCRDGGWQRLLAAEDAAPSRGPGEAPSPQHARSAAGTHASASDRIASMSTPLFGSNGLLGLLTARDRLGDVRSFDLGDVQLLETVGSELSTAFERGQLLADLQRTATTDPLTGLANLSETTRALNEALARTPDGMVVAALNVDSFREVNDTLGHEVGDAVLLETTARLVRSHRGALIGRIGGGRFAVALPSNGGELSPQLFGLALRAHVEGEARVGVVGTHIRLSVGVTQSPEHGTDAETLLRRAETAMTSARQAHGGPVAWAPAYEVEGQRRLAVVTALREAVVTGAIGLAFQPKLDLRTGAVSGVEALARWTHPALGQVSPDEFIPLAETSGFIGPLTSAVLRQAATACRGWQRRATGVGVAVNVSADTVLDPLFVTEVGALLTSVGLAPELLTLELTEGVVVSDPRLAVERLGELRALGVHIAVDDFGTGYSSLTYLKGLPVDEVKIDKGFVAALGTDPADRAVVRAVVDIAHTLGLRVVAEGVEDLVQEEILRALDVDEVQGYLHARPMPAQAVSAWLRTRHTTVRH